LLNAIDRADVRIIEGREQARFARKPRPALRVTGEEVLIENAEGCGGVKCCRKTIACLLAARMSGDGPGDSAPAIIQPAVL
jgi:hypothetical protein